MNTLTLGAGPVALLEGRDHLSDFRSTSREIFGYEGGGDSSPLIGRFDCFVFGHARGSISVVRPGFVAEVLVIAPTGAIEYCTGLIRGTEALRIYCLGLDADSDSKSSF